MGLIFIKDVPECLNQLYKSDEFFFSNQGTLAQMVVHMTQEPEVRGWIPGPFPLLLKQEGQLLVTGKSICT